MSDSKEMQEALEFFQGDEFAASTFLNKYALRDKEGNILEKNPDQTIERVMTVLAGAMPTEFPTDEWLNKYNENKKESWKEIFIKGCNKFKGICPQGSVLAAAGNEEFPQSLSNCFVIPPPSDRMSGIMRANDRMANIFKRRGGCGIDLSTLRPEGAGVKNAANTSSGAWGWANHFSNTGRDVGQNGRRAAEMLSLHIKHPDAAKWATMKRDLKYCTGANVSLWITDEFMQAVKNNKKFLQQFPIDSDSPTITKEIEAKDLWKTICASAHEMAEPGLLNYDTITKTLPAHCYPSFKVSSTNPCSEIPLSNFDSCRLISIRLVDFVTRPFTRNAFFDFERFEKAIRVTIRMGEALVDSEIKHIDNILTKILKERDSVPPEEKEEFNLEIELWEKIKNAAGRGRRLGLGDHGWGDMLACLCVKYDSMEALKIAAKIKSFYRDIAYDESVELAKEFGPFPEWSWEIEKDCEFFRTFPEELVTKMKKYGRRHISLLTNAPTGSISILGQCSSGIEPTFKQMYIRRRKINASDLNARVDFIDQSGDKWMEFPQFEKNVIRYFQTRGEPLPKVKTDEELSEYLPKYFITSDKIDWKKRIDFQMTLQQFVDHSISSTLNLPENVSIETVNDLYFYAWEKGLKGVTIYRQNSRSGVLLSQETYEKQKESKRPEKVTRLDAPKRPKILDCDVHFTRVKGTQYVVIVGLLQGSVYEVFFGKYNNQIPEKQFSGLLEKRGKNKYFLVYEDEGKTNQVDINKYFDNEEYATATRLLSMSLRHHAPLEYIVDQLQKSAFSIVEFGSAIARILKKYIKIEELQKTAKCDNCNSKNVNIKTEDGCLSVVCNNCSVVTSKCN